MLPDDFFSAYSALMVVEGPDGEDDMEYVIHEEEEEDEEEERVEIELSELPALLMEAAGMLDVPHEDPS